MKECHFLKLMLKEHNPEHHSLGSKNQLIFFSLEINNQLHAQLLLLPSHDHKMKLIVLFGNKTFFVLDLLQKRLMNFADVLISILFWVAQTFTQRIFFAEVCLNCKGLNLKQKLNCKNRTRARKLKLVRNNIGFGRVLK